MNLRYFKREEMFELSWQKPMMAQIELTRNCNQRCMFCFGSCCPQKQYPVLSTEQWKSIIMKLKKLGVRRLNFSGGENFLYKGFVELVAFAKVQGFEVIINTNGTFSCGQIVGNSDEIIFSVHGLEETHDSITGRQGSFREVRKHITEVAGMVRVSVNTVLIRPNYRQLNDVFEYFDGLCDLHKFSPTISVRSSFGFNHDDCALDVTRELIADYKQRLEKIPTKKLELKHGFQSIFFSDRQLYCGPAFPLPNCAGGKYKLVVEYNGDVYPCNFFKGPEFFCGNILYGNEQEIWRMGRGFNRFRELVLNEKIPQKCQGCIKKPRCFSGCRAWAQNYQKGGFENEKDSRCELGDAFVGS